jgi:hypothetical protein
VEFDGEDDHVHLLVNYPPKVSVFNLVNSLKGVSSMGLSCGHCGLRACFGERGRSEEWPGESGVWPGTANSGGCRSPQASAGTPNNTRELAQTDKKKPQLITVGASVLVVGWYPAPNDY